MTVHQEDAELERKIVELLPSSSGARTRKGWHSTGTVELAAKLVDASGVVEKAHEWRCQDDAWSRAKRPVKDEQRDPGFGKRGGRPAMFTTRQVLIIMLLHSVTGEPLLIKELATTVHERLNPRSRELLGLPADPSDMNCGQVYTNFRRALRRFLDAIDSAPHSTGRRLRYSEVLRIRAMRAEESENLAEKSSRGSWVANQLLHMTYLYLPKEVRANWRGTISVDGTAVPVWGKAGSPGAKKRTLDSMCSPEFDAGWHSRTAEDHNGEKNKDHNGDKGRKRLKRTQEEFKWAYEATIAVMAEDPDCVTDFPKLALSVSLEKPAGRVAENAMVCVGAIVDRGLPINYFVGDRAYLPHSDVDKLQGPLKALGYKFVADLRSDQLGIQGQHAGALLVEGTWYCPSMPTALIEASIDHLNKKISDDTYQRLIDARRDYMLQTKEKADSNGVVQMRCPAMGPNPTVDCPLKPQKQTSVGLGIPKLRTKIIKPPKHPDRICSNRSSVAFGPDAGANEAGLKYGQAVPYRSKEWHTLYQTPRSTIEGLNAMVKDEGKGALGSAGRRRARGYTFQSLCVAVLLAGANIRMIDSFLAKPIKTTAERIVARTDRRRRKQTLDSYRQRANAPPLVGPAAEAAN
ncbi:MAG: hypothetical protein ACRC20_12375 [Segniliparus sp.]|uniref:hypothetical protein n=1 Tax=Segniliparus sp. TaxID=2804064 RepID=UPI003F369D06